MLGLLLASNASFPTSSRAGDGNGSIAVGEPGSGDPGTKGDPDGPSGPSRRYGSGYQANRGRAFVAPSAGDGGAAWRGWIGRVQMLLRNWLARWTQF
jgi:hypothetical protein